MELLQYKDSVTDGRQINKFHSSDTEFERRKPLHMAAQPTGFERDTAVSMNFSLLGRQVGSGLDLLRKPDKKIGNSIRSYKTLQPIRDKQFTRMDSQANVKTSDRFDFSNPYGPQRYVF